MSSKRFIRPLLALLLATLAACQPTPPALPTAQPSATVAQLAAEPINPTATAAPPQPTGTHTATPLPAATTTRRPRPTITQTPLPTTPTYAYAAELVTTLGLGSILDIAFHPTNPDTALVTTPFGTYGYTSGQAPALLSEGSPLIYSPDGTLVISGLEVRDGATGALLFTLAENTFAASFQADGQFVTASVWQQGVGTHQEVFAAATGELLQTLPGIAMISFNQAGTALLATQQFGRFIVYSWPDLSEAYRIDPPMRGDIPAGVPAFGIFLP
ncbi:MAG: hypothetical protein KDE59_18645, partial [Anaerolineales bacterium]|nr:hypothetical protein [Anaerolineales bacterium]